MPGIDTPMVFDDFVPVCEPFSDCHVEKVRELIAEKYNRDIVDLKYTSLISPEEIEVKWISKSLPDWEAEATIPRDEPYLYKLRHDGRAQSTVIDLFERISFETIADSDR